MDSVKLDKWQSDLYPEVSCSKSFLQAIKVCPSSELIGPLNFLREAWWGDLFSREFVMKLLLFFKFVIRIKDGKIFSCPREPIFLIKRNL